MTGAPGSTSRSAACSASSLVRIARRSTLVCTTSGSRSVLAQQLAAAPGLGLALGGQVDVDPAGEQVLRVPLALAVPEQHQRPHSHAAILAQRSAAAGTHPA